MLEQGLLSTFPPLYANARNSYNVVRCIEGRWHGGKFGGGTTGGSPLVLYKAQPAAGGRGVGGAPASAPAPAPSASSNAKYRSIVMSPMDNFMAGALEHPAAILSGEGEDAYSVGGLFATLTEVPAGYTHPTVLVGGHGISSAVMDWGDVLLKKTRKVSRCVVAMHRVLYI